MNMKYSDLVKRNANDLRKQEEQLRIELMKHAAQVATGAPGKDSGKIRELKRSIARIRMALAQKETAPLGGDAKQ